METTMCERCNGLGELCRQGDTPPEPGRRHCWVREVHGGACEVGPCSRCGGLGYYGCSRCGEPVSLERWTDSGADHESVLCGPCECGSTHGSATSGNDGIPAVEPTEPGRVWAADWERAPYQAPVAGVYDNDDDTRELPAIGGL